MSQDPASALIRSLFDAVRDLPETRRHARLVELGADPIQIAEIDAMFITEGETAVYTGDESARSGPAREAGSELDSGDALDSWRLLERIGSGGMGAVFLAERSDGSFEQQVAIKLIRGTPDVEAFVHFARERQILARLQHPNIARLLDGGSTPGGQPYLVMEYIEGVTIGRYCDEHGLGLDARLRLFQKVCAAVQFAHQRLIVHCDLKPSNVLVRADGEPVLLDFGVARALDQQLRGEDAARNAWITPLYASPEQLRGEAVTTTSDVFSLGLILFELIAGRRARLDAEDHTITLLGQSEIKPSVLARDVEWRGRLGGDLDAIVQKAVASDPARRYATAAELSADLQHHFEHRPLQAREPTLRYRLACLLRRRWPAFATAALVALAIAGFTAQLMRERDRALEAEREAQVQAHTAEKVSDFLVSVFNVANPKYSLDRKPTARDVLDEGAARIESELADAPAVKARMLDVLGTAYRHIGIADQSVSLLNQAAELYQDPRVDQPLAAARVFSQLAVIYSNNAYPLSLADAAVNESLRLRERFAQPDSHEMADSYNTLGVVREAEDRFDEAEQALQKALAIRVKLEGESSLQVASTLHNLGLVEYSRGKHLDKALEYYERSLAIKKQHVGEKSPAYIETLDNHAKVLRVMGRREEAAAEFRRILVQAVAVYGEDSENVAGIHNELGNVVHDMGRFREAAAEYRADMAIRRKLDGADSAAYATPLNNLASALEDMGDYAAAEPLFRESLALRRQGQDPGSARVARAVGNLARLLLERGQLAESGSLVIEAQAMYAKLNAGKVDARVLKLQMLEAERQLALGQADTARVMLEPVRTAAGELDARDQARLESLSARLAPTPEAALAASQLAWMAIRKAWGEGHPLTLAYGLDLAERLHATGKTAQARAILDSVAGLIDAFAESSPLHARLAAVQRALGKAAG